MFIHTDKIGGIVDVYPFIDDLNRETAFSPRIEVFPKQYRDSRHLDGKGVRYAGQTYTKEEWDAELAQLIPAMDRAFEIADELSK